MKTYPATTQLVRVDDNGENSTMLTVTPLIGFNLPKNKCLIYEGIARSILDKLSET